MRRYGYHCMLCGWRCPAPKTARRGWGDTVFMNHRKVCPVRYTWEQPIEERIKSAEARKLTLIASERVQETTICQETRHSTDINGKRD